MAEQPTHDAAIDEIKALEDRRYRAMIAGDTAVLGELCSDDLIYTHSKADYDDKPSYLHKVGSRYFTYLEITHPADRILVVDGAALVTGRMTAKVLVAGTIVCVDNRYLAVWVREHGAWKFVAYQPKGLVAKLPNSRRYQLLPHGYSICLVFLKLFERVYAPLTAGLLSPVSADRQIDQQKRSQLDRLYQRVVDDLDALVRAVGLKVA